MDKDEVEGEGKEHTRCMKAVNSTQGKTYNQHEDGCRRHRRRRQQVPDRIFQRRLSVLTLVAVMWSNKLIQKAV